MLKIYRPIKTNALSQGFGANYACSPNGALTPVTTSGPFVPCPLGTSPLYPKLGLKGHNGQDWMAYRGEPVYHSGDFTGWMKTEIDNNGGIGVRVISDNPVLDNQHCLLLYWHLKEIVGYDKKPIRSGDLIGYADSTGLSSGDHVHFSLKQCTQKGDTINNNNGYTGAIDQAPYFTNQFIVDVMKIEELKPKIVDILNKIIFQLKLILKSREGK